MKIWNNIFLPLFSSFREIFHSVPAGYGYPNTGPQNLIRKGFLNRKRNEIFKIIIGYYKLQEHISFLAFKVRLPPSKKSCFMYFNHSLLKTVKLSFMSSLKLFSFLRYLIFVLNFSVVQKTAWQESYCHSSNPT